MMNGLEASEGRGEVGGSGGERQLIVYGSLAETPYIVRKRGFWGREISFRFELLGRSKGALFVLAMVVVRSGCMPTANGYNGARGRGEVVARSERS